MITRLAGGPAIAGVLEATADSAPDAVSETVLAPLGVGCSTLAAGAAETSVGVADGCWGRDGATTPAAEVGTGGLASCGADFAGVATPAAAPVETDAGGFTITGPEGGRDAMAGVGVGGVETICGACRGKGTIFRAAGLDADPALTDTALTGDGVKAVLLTVCCTVEVGAGEAETAVDFAAVTAAAAVTAGRCATVAPECVPRGASRCSFCC